MLSSINTFFMQVILHVWNYDLTLLEFVAVVASLIGVWLGTTGKTWTWPWWAISSALYGWLFWQWNLKASAILQIVFIIAAIVGWFGWGPKGAKPRTATSRQIAVVVAVDVVIWLALVPVFKHIGAAATWPDSFGLVFSVVAQIIMVKEFRESWAVWFIVDAVYSIEYFTQKLWFTAALYVLFTAIALRGWLRWGSDALPLRKELGKAEPAIAQSDLL